METITKSAQETKDLGRKIGASLRGGEILALTGDLGSGKTTFVQGLAEGLGIEKNIISPTFILMKKYETGEKDLYHVDLYRLEGDATGELKNLGAMDFWGKENSIFVVEWAEKAQSAFPQNTRWIEFEYMSENERIIKT